DRRGDGGRPDHGDAGPASSPAPRGQQVRALADLEGPGRSRDHQSDPVVPGAAAAAVRRWCSCVDGARYPVRRRFDHFARYASADDGGCFRISRRVAAVVRARGVPADAGLDRRGRTAAWTPARAAAVAHGTGGRIVTRFPGVIERVEPWSDAQGEPAVAVSVLVPVSERPEELAGIYEEYSRPIRE